MQSLKMLKLLLLMAILRLCDARYIIQPKFYAQDSAVIVDTDKVGTQDLRSKYRPIQPYPMYQILQPTQKLKSESTLVPQTSTTLSHPASGSDLQAELVEIAKERLGLKTIEEIPSISELGELLGTTTDDETMKYIRHLTNTDQGVALIKAYMETSDYTDNTGSLNEQNSGDNKVNAEDNEHKNQPSKVTIPTTPQPTPGLFDRFADYFKNYNFWSDQRKAPIPSTIELKRISQIEKYQKLMQHSRKHFPMSATSLNQKSIFVRKPLPPYHYPIPLRPVMHINTPKLYIPYVEIAKAINVPPKQLEKFLQNNPKVADLAARVSRLVSHDKTAFLNDQILAAVERAISQDEHFKKLLSETETLK